MPSKPPARLRQVADLLGVAPGMRVLEIGGGRGVLAELLLERLGPTGQLIGVDRSATAVAAAVQRNAAAVRAGRAVFQQQSVERIAPGDIGVVDVVVAVNVNVFWVRPAGSELAALARVLSAQGLLWLVYHPPELSVAARVQPLLVDHLRRAGYRAEIITATDPEPMVAVRALPQHGELRDGSLR